jgi:hypothetical protein
MIAHCKRCGEVWPRDPALEVECPDCHVSAGTKCRRPSGHACDIHAARDRLAMASGFLATCPATSPTFGVGEPGHRTPTSQLSLF